VVPKTIVLCRFRICWKNCKKMHAIKVLAKKSAKKSALLTFTYTFFYLTLLGEHFCSFSSGFVLIIKFWVFVTHLDFFQKYVSVLNVFFGNCGAKFARNGAKYRENKILLTGLRVLFSTHSSWRIFNFLKNWQHRYTLLGGRADFRTRDCLTEVLKRYQLTQS